MRNIKRLIIALFLLVLSGCGAKLEYNMHVDTNWNKIKLEIQMMIEESDYKYILGGRDSLVEIIMNSKPTQINFRVDEMNNNKYLFSIDFAGYEEYKQIYKEITGIESISHFEVIEKSELSPFTSSENIELNDDLSLLMKWLEDELMNSGIVPEDKRGDLIDSKSYKYQFNDNQSTSYGTEFNEEVISTFENVSVNLTLKKQDMIDFELAFSIVKEEDTTLKENLKTYLNVRKIDYDIESVEIELDGKTYEQYSIKVSDLNLLDNFAEQSLNGLFGEGFSKIIYETKSEESFWKDKKYQNTDMIFNPNKLFGLNLELKVLGIANVEGLSINSELQEDFELPNISNVFENELLQIKLHTIYEKHKLLSWLFIGGISAVLLIVLKKSKPKKMIQHFQPKLISIYEHIKAMVFNCYFTYDIEVNKNCIVGANFIINNKKISKVAMENSWHKNIVYISLIMCGFSIILFVSKHWIAGFALLLLAVLFSLIAYMIYKVLAISLELESGKKYYFSFRNDEKTKEVYNDLISKLNMERKINESFHLKGKGTEYE